MRKKSAYTYAQISSPRECSCECPRAVYYNRLTDGLGLLFHLLFMFIGCGVYSCLYNVFAPTAALFKNHVSLWIDCLIRAISIIICFPSPPPRFRMVVWLYQQLLRMNPIRIWSCSSYKCIRVVFRSSVTAGLTHISRTHSGSCENILSPMRLV